MLARLRVPWAWALVLALPLLAPIAALAGQAADDAEQALAALAQDDPDDAFHRTDLLLPTFRRSLLEAGFSQKHDEFWAPPREWGSETTLTNSQMLVLFQQFREHASSRADGLFPGEEPEEQAEAAAPPALGDKPALPPVDSETLRRLKPGEEDGEAGAQEPGRDLDRMFENAGNKEKHGLRFMGVDVGSGYDPEQDESYLREGIDRVLDWDVHAKVRPDSLGFRAKYRAPPGLKDLTVKYKRETDTAGLLNLEGLRDDVYKYLGKETPKKKEGFDINATAVVNEYFGAHVGHMERTEKSGDRKVSQHTESVGVGVTPLGNNEGKPWNYSLMASTRYQEIRTEESGKSECKEGFSCSVGAAGQYALSAVPIPVLHGWTWARENVRLDRVSARASVSESEITGLSADAAVDLSVQVTRRIFLSVGTYAQWAADPERGQDGFRYGPQTGANVRF